MPPVPVRIKGGAMKLLTVCVPCYNSQDYMEHCLKTILVGGDRVEILIIDDGSKDGTPAIADRYEKDYPGIVRAIHKENGGHGSGVNRGIDEASGLFYKVVDSDDWVDETLFCQVLDRLQEIVDSGKNLDMMVCNYTYAKTGVLHQKVINYKSALPVDRLFTWDDAKHFRKGNYILMHAVIYRTQMLRECGMRLPEHCFYVDNIYVFDPFPYVHDMYYMNVNLYQYYIGREDQSVHENVMISRLDQQYKVTYHMIDFYERADIQEKMAACGGLQRYMYNYLEILITISSIMSILSRTPEHIKMKDDMWDYMEATYPALYHRLRRGFFGTSVSRRNAVMHFLCRFFYRIANRIFHFN